MTLSIPAIIKLTSKQAENSSDGVCTRCKRGLAPGADIADDPAVHGIDAHNGQQTMVVSDADMQAAAVPCNVHAGAANAPAGDAADAKDQPTDTDHVVQLGACWHVPKHDLPQLAASIKLLL